MVGPLLAGFIRESKGWSVEVLVLGVLWLASAVPTVSSFIPLRAIILGLLKVNERDR